MSSTKAPDKHHKDTKHEGEVPLKQRTDKEVRERDDQLDPRNDKTEQEKSLEKDRQPIREALEGKGVSLTFPTVGTWQIAKNGKTDSGSLTVPINTIVAAADKL